MLYWLIDYFDILYRQTIASLGLRSLLAVMTSMAIVLMAGKPVIAYLRNLKYGQAVRTDGPKNAPCQARHANDGWCADFVCHWDFYFAVGKFDKPLCMDFDGGHGHLWGGRLA